MSTDTAQTLSALAAAAGVSLNLAHAAAGGDTLARTDTQALVAVGCNGGPGGGNPFNPDAEESALVDVIEDGFEDAGPDGGYDGGYDAGYDGGPEAGPLFGVDAGFGGPGGPGGFFPKKEGGGGVQTELCLQSPVLNVQKARLK